MEDVFLKFIIEYIKKIMFGFIDSASEHAVALLHFHNYAMFFLVLIVVFVIWLLRLVLRFVFFEKNLSAVGSDFGFFTFSENIRLSLNFLVARGYVEAGSIPVLSNTMLVVNDALYALVSTINVAKAYYAYSPAHKELDNSKDDVYPLFPSAADSTELYKRFTHLGNLFKLSEFVGGASERSILHYFRLSFSDVDFLFSGDSDFAAAQSDAYLDAGTFITYNTYMNSYTLLAKHDLQDKLINAVSKISGYQSLSLSQLFGYSANRERVFFKTMSNFYVSSTLFSQFYTSDRKMFFYLFFQHVRHRKALEWFWTCLPAFILLLLLYPSLILLYCYDRPHITKPYFTFKAIGHQWYWSYEYSDFVTTQLPNMLNHIQFDSYMVHFDDLKFGEFRLLEVDNRVVLPIGVCSRLIVTAADVLHSWSLPALGVKIDAIPGRLNQFWVVVDRPGTFYGQCSELCGINHGFMPIVVESASFTDFFRTINSMFVNL